jgi:hypothetical protein
MTMIYFKHLENVKYPIILKRMFCTVLLMTFMVMDVCAWNLYVPNSDCSKYVRDNSLKGLSIADVCKRLGYADDKHYLWIAFDANAYFAFKSLSKDIICILIDGDKGDSITAEDVNQILKDYEFDYNSEYSPTLRESFLNKGIHNKSISQSFLESITHKTAIDNKLVDKLNGYIYTLSDGYLISFNSDDGLVGYAKEFKGTPMFNRIKENAENYYENNDDIIAEINMQCDYLASIDPDYISYASKPKYNYNFALLYIDTKKPQISLADFNKITHGEANAVKITQDQTILSYKGNVYCFNANKILSAIY